MGNISTVDALIESYEQGVLEGLNDEENYESEALLVLLARDDIEDRISELSPEQCEHVRRLDAVMAEKHDRVAAVLPNALSVDRRRWWWFLHEGPQVADFARASDGSSSASAA